MNKSKKWTMLIFLIISILYFGMFIIPNLLGVKDINMISAFEHDEFAQYPNVIHMLTPGETPYQSLRNFVVYLHYYYGYPFYFFSALAILPVKLILGSGWINHTDIIMMVLRQAINVLPIILSAWLMTWVVTRFHSRLKSLLCFILLLTLPAVISNNLWWHPDSLLTLFVVLTIFFLDRDDFRFGKYFYLSGVACGLAIGSKILGVLFIITYIVYLFYGLFSKKITFKRFVLAAILGLAAVLGTVVVTNPLLLLPIERGEIINIFKTNLAQSTVGFWVKGNGENSQLAAIQEIFSQNYSSIFLAIFSITILIMGLFRNATRTRSMIILTWLIGYLGYFVVFASTLRAHYLIPAALPLLSGMFLLIPDNGLVKSETILPRSKEKIARLILLILIPTIVFIQVVANLPNGIQIYKESLIKEINSGSIQLFTTASDKFLNNIPSDVRVKIYRDWRAYVEPRDNYEISYNWSLANYEYIHSVDPDLLFIEFDNAYYFSDQSKIDQAIRPDEMKEMVKFYTDVISEHVGGYRLLMKTDFGYVFAKDEFFIQFFDKE